MGLESIVNVQITKGTTTVSTAGFGRALILGLHTRFAERSRLYTDPDDMLDDGFLTSDNEYKAAVSLMRQSKRPRDFRIGRRTAAVAQVVTITPTPVNTFTYTVTINGTLHSFLSDADATASEIVAGLLALINAGAQSAFVTATGTTTLIVTSDNAGEPFSYSVGANLAAVLTTPNNGVTEDMQAVDDESVEGADWYCLILTSHSDSDIRVAAGTIESQTRMFSTASSNSDIKTSVTTDLGSYLKGKAYVRTFMLWSADLGNYPEAAWDGRVLPNDPGSETWKFKTLAGITPDNLTANELTNLRFKNVNHYRTLGGVNITAEGETCQGEFIDVTRFLDFVVARMQEGIYSKLVNVEKVPFTDSGVGIIESEIRKVILLGQRVGGIALTPEPTVTAPKVADVPLASRQARILPDVQFTFTLSGAIHATDPINGTVSV